MVERQDLERPDTGEPSETDWNRLDTMRDDDIDLSDASEMTPEMFARAVVKQGLKPKQAKAQVTLRIDHDVLEWFRGLGAGYQTRINTLLRAYMEAHGEQNSR